MKRITIASAVAALTLALSGCATWSPESRGTAIGAGVGAAAGNLITGGSTLGTVGGAAAGGIIGHELGKEYHHR